MNQAATADEDTTAASPDSTPRVWLVTGYRAGERSQVIGLGEALGWPFELKELGYRKTEFRTSLFRGSDLRGIRLEASSPLAPPWPDLVISAGMRNEPVCRWIRRQSGGRTRIVHIGRPWATLERFDLVITTPQYRLAERENVLHNATTLHRVTPARLEAEARRWTARFDDLPRPFTGVILGGNSGPYTMGAKAATRIAEQASTMAERSGGSLLVSTSSRTPAAAVEVLRHKLRVPHYLYRWQPGDTDNPYFALLALSDALIVSADSIAMLSEACATGKPVYMAELGGYGYPMRSPSTLAVDFRPGALAYSWLMRLGPKRLSRDICLVHRRLREQGRAVWLGEEFQARGESGETDLQRAVARVRALLGNA
jgi:mitochondrial fission protein ELM1